MVIATMPNVCTMGRQSASSDGSSGGRIAAAFSPSTDSWMPRRSSHPTTHKLTLAMNGMRQPHVDACSAPSHSVHEPRRRGPEDEPQGGARGRGAADKTAPRRRGLLGGVDHRPGELAAKGEPLDDAQGHQQHWRGDADLRVGRQQPDQQRRAAHQRDRQREQRAASDAVAHHAKHEAAERPRDRSPAQTRQRRAAVGRWGSTAERTVDRCRWRSSRRRQSRTTRGRCRSSRPSRSGAPTAQERRRRRAVQRSTTAHP